VLRRILLLSFLGLVFSFGCGGSAQEEGKPSGASCDPALTYTNDIAPLMERYCLRCHAQSVPLSQRHGAPGDHNFETERGLLAQAEHVDLLAGAGPESTNRSMPPKGFGPAPSDDERALLAAFLACELEGGHDTHMH
jgi:uncharacterized membrane protein